MSVRKFAVIGHPIGHTMSPFIHKRLFELAGISGQYGIIDIAPQELPARIKELNELAGYNITIPNKQAIIPFLDSLDPKAELYGSVNTVRNGSERQGYTTDPDGFLKALEAAGIPFQGDICILGSGGVARTFMYEAARAGCNITIAARSEESARRLADEVRNKLIGASVSCCLISELDLYNKDFDLLINGTPVGMFPHTENIPVSHDTIGRSRYVFDAVYNPLETNLILKAKGMGKTAVGGMSMLVWQAVAAHEIWDGSQYRKEDIEQLILDSANEMKKIF